MPPKYDYEKLAARTANIEKQLSFVLKILGMDLSALREAPDTELVKYYRDAIQLLGLRENQFAPEIIELWAELFCQFTEYEFVRLQELVEYDHTWEPFYQLCTRMMTALRHRKGFAQDSLLKNLYAYLNKGLKNLRGSAVLMMDKYPQTLSEKAKILLKEDDLDPLLEKSEN